MESISKTYKRRGSNISIPKETIEWIVLTILLIFSFINSITLLLFLLSLLLFLRQKEIGALKIINIITLRTIINPGIAVNIGEWQNLKWLIMFLCAFYLLKSYSKTQEIYRKKIKGIVRLVLLFTVYNVIASFWFSTLPTVAIFKLLSYVVIFMSVLIGIGYTHNKIDWLKWMLKIFVLFMSISIPMISMSLGYLRTGSSFQGLSNHPNMFGLLAALFVGILLTCVQTKRINNYFLVILLSSITIYMVVLSKSRTAFITCVVLFLMYTFFININRYIKVMIINMVTITMIVILVSDNFILSSILDILYKGNTDIFSSRQEQIGGLVANFLRNPLFGNGFAVPVTPFRTYSFSSDYIVEPGNLIIAVLSYSGITGFILFSSYIYKMFWTNIREFKFVGFLPVSVLIINMGEMVFFSSNNIGVWIYMFWAIYVFDTR
ncbi:hypothetical protein CIB95_11600 [Lottiidibacillus patelloidae]|uniref:O-antigen ligase-related domain-containing protein n=1 Tax=Lottiidibacillus patelloidae TaxID=2670334 RepID=A0A263BS61_9BACI|nr:O-antigen ligase family protein [Lottiidibacillus patelloidae]OZM56412.1 hypothetical protein CIB95_11600 [Lottiidibacillus patelloidae]